MRGTPRHPPGQLSLPPRNTDAGSSGGGPLARSPRQPRVDRGAQGTCGVAPTDDAVEADQRGARARSGKAQGDPRAWQGPAPNQRPPGRRGAGPGRTATSCGWARRAPDHGRAGEHAGRPRIRCEQIRGPDDATCAPAWGGAGSRRAFFTAVACITDQRSLTRLRKQVLCLSPRL